MNKKVVAFISVLLIIALVYFGGLYYYANKFTFNTTFASVKIGGLTPEAAEEKLINGLNKQTIVIEENGQSLGKVKVADLQLKYNLKENLQDLYKRQDANLWFVYLFKPDKITSNLETAISVEPARAEEVFVSQSITNEARKDGTNASIEFDDKKGYYVKPEIVGTKVDYNRLTQATLNALGNQKDKVELKDGYQLPAVMKDSPSITKMMGIIDEILATQLTLDIADEKVVIPREKILSWIYFDKSSRLVLDQAKISEYLVELNDKYGTFNKVREFDSTLNGKVEVIPGYLGWEIDTEKEAAQIAKDLYEAKNVTRKPVVSSTGGVPGQANDIGDTYVEVSLANQYMWLYIDGKLIVETPIISGQPATPTVPGAGAIKSKEANTVLRGFNPIYKKKYEAPVAFWMPFDDNAQGLHDASWQYTFGGNTNQWSGSLGCINTPYDAVAAIYENVEVGTPVIVY